MEKKWYAVYTKPRWEKRVASLLVVKEVEHYCPLNSVVKQWSDRRKKVYEPLIPSYVFVHVSSAEMVKVQKTDGIINFVHLSGKPAVIRQQEIDVIKDFLNKHRNVKVAKIDVNVNDTVRITCGPLMNQEGNVIEVSSNKVKVVLPSLGFLLVAEVEKANITTSSSH
ncbi:transcription termination/antitermination protein NusG [Pontibacter anaerobius]|uniref:UpxY family transcription antiterminator n=1 Tax=Pontibacter anaerobius TaxID=2993940 RepID=A0ABT3RHQ8_9BACT|nr:UpxY family transcription antiterminator [Pontibacter anaerobius]MCX2740976.1 UpxY family transcription antiterminator [Pontibacter anaerobius]